MAAPASIQRDVSLPKSDQTRSSPNLRAWRVTSRCS